VTASGEAPAPYRPRWLISAPVLKGFIVGLALTIMAGQLPKLFGVPKGSGDFIEQLAFVLGHVGDTNVPTVIVGVTSLPCPC
jgi:SulP family sulfate permease